MTVNLIKGPKKEGGQVQNYHHFEVRRGNAIILTRDFEFGFNMTLNLINGLR